MQNAKHEQYKRESLFDVGNVDFDRPQSIKNIFFEQDTGEKDQTEEKARKEREEMERALIEKRGPSL